MDGWISDARQAARGLVTHKGYAALAVLTLALGIGATTAVFNLANWLLLRPVPGIGQQDRLVTIGFGAESARGPVALLDLQQLEAGMPALTGLAGYQEFSLHVAAPGEAPRRTSAEVVTGNYFDVLAGPIAMGRGFTAIEGLDPDAPPTVVISDRLWRSLFGGGADVLGRDLVINSTKFTIVGVTARGFHGTSLGGAIDLWTPVAQHAKAVPTYPRGVLTDRRVRMLFGLVGRLAPDATARLATEQAEAVRASLAEAYPEDRRLGSWSFQVTSGLESRPWVRERLERAMTLLMGIVALLLVLTSANVANLMLGRASGRRSEIATRLALGASRFRVVRLLLVESVLLSMLAGAVAVVVAVGVGWLLQGTTVLAGVPALARAELDWRVLAFAVGVSALVGALAGVLPALAGSRIRAAMTLREAGRSQTGNRRRLRRALSTAQVVVSITLLVGAGLLARSMSARLALDPGYDPSRVLAFSVEPGLQGYGPRQEVFYRDLIDRVRVTPGVRAAGLAWLRPFSQNAADTAFKPEGAGDDAEVSAHLNAVSPGFFDAMGLRLVDGRDFNDAEFQRSATEGDAVAILTESLARRLFDGRPAVGRRLEGSFAGSPTRTIVGVVADTRQRRLDREQEDTLFEPFGQPFPTGWATMVVGLQSPDAGQTGVRAALRQVVTALDPTLPIYDVTTLDVAMRAQLADDLLVMRLTLTFALLATLLAAIGLYGVLARGVGERQQEIGIRTALGARPGAIAGLVTREAASVLAWGLALGLPLCWWLTRFLESRLFDVSRLDAVAFGGAVLLVIAVTMVSALPAARRAARLDPALVLRNR